MLVEKNGFQKICLILGLYIMIAVMIGYFRTSGILNAILPESINPINWNETTQYIYVYSIGLSHYLIGTFLPPILMTFILVILYYIAYPFWELKESIKTSKFPIIYALMVIAFLIFYWIHWENDIYVYI